MIIPGKYAAECRSGRMFIGSTAAAGVAMPIVTGTAVTFGVWNNTPDMVLVPHKFSGGYTSGTIALGSLAVAKAYAGIGAQVNEKLTAFTPGTPLNAHLGGGAAPRMTFIPATATLAASQSAALLYTGNSIESATAGLGIFKWDYEFDGSVALDPGFIMFAASSVAQTALFSMSLLYSEVPLAVWNS